MADKTGETDYKIYIRLPNGLDEKYDEIRKFIDAIESTVSSEVLQITELGHAHGGEVIWQK